MGKLREIGGLLRAVCASIVLIVGLAIGVVAALCVWGMPYIILWIIVEYYR